MSLDVNNQGSGKKQAALDLAELARESGKVIVY